MRKGVEVTGNSTCRSAEAVCPGEWTQVLWKGSPEAAGLPRLWPVERLLGQHPGQSFWKQRRNRPRFASWEVRAPGQAERWGRAVAIIGWVDRRAPDGGLPGTKGSRVRQQGGAGLGCNTWEGGPGIGPAGPVGSGEARQSAGGGGPRLLCVLPWSPVGRPVLAARPPPTAPSPRPQCGQTPSTSGAESPLSDNK